MIGTHRYHEPLRVRKSSGIGTRYQNVKSELSNEDESELIFNGDNNPNYWLHNSGKQIRPKIHFGLRIDLSSI